MNEEAVNVMYGRFLERQAYLERRVEAVGLVATVDQEIREALDTRKSETVRANTKLKSELAPQPKDGKN